MVVLHSNNINHALVPATGFNGNSIINGRIIVKKGSLNEITPVNSVKSLKTEIV